MSGDTKSHKETLKAAAYAWSPKKSMWYFRPAKAHSKKRFAVDKSEWPMDTIRETFGAERPTYKPSFITHLA